MNRTTKIIIAVVVVIIIAAIALTRGSSDANALRIGDISTLTGPVAFIGQSTMKGTEIGKIKAESEHPGMKIELFHEDSLFTPKGGIDAYTKLRDADHVNAVVSMASNVSVAVEPVIAKDNIIHVAVSTLANNFSTPDDLSVRLTAKADVEAGPAIKYLQSKGLKRLGVLYMNNEIGISLNDSLLKTVTGTDVKIVSAEGFATDIKDFRSQLAKMKSAGVDSIYIASIAPLAATALTQANELGLKVPFLSYRAAEDPLLIQNAGKLAENVIYTSAYDITDQSPANKEFYDAYKKKYNEEPNGYAAEAYEAVRLIADARAKCGTDTTCEKAFLASVSGRPSVLGELTFDNFGDVKYTFFLKTVRDGKFVRVQ